MCLIFSEYRFTSKRTERVCTKSASNIPARYSVCFQIVLNYHDGLKAQQVEYWILYSVHYSVQCTFYSVGTLYCTYLYDLDFKVNFFLPGLSYKKAGILKMITRKNNVAGRITLSCTARCGPMGMLLLCGPPQYRAAGRETNPCTPATFQPRSASSPAHRTGRSFPSPTG